MAAMKHSIVVLLAFGFIFVLPALSQDSSVVKTAERIGEEGGASIYKETIHLKPPFYEGSLPLVYETGRGGKMGSIAYWQKFDGWRNQFSYNDVMSLETAEARNREEKLLAEAELVEVQTSPRRMIYPRVGATHFAWGSFSRGQQPAKLASPVADPIAGIRMVSSRWPPKATEKFVELRHEVRDLRQSRRLEIWEPLKAAWL